QTQHLGTEILATVGPAQAATRDHAETQMHAFHTWRVHPDFAEWHRLGRIRYLVRIELEADEMTRFAVDLLEIAGTGRGANDVHVALDDALVIKTGDTIEQHLDRFPVDMHLLVARFFQAGDGVVDEIWL